MQNSSDVCIALVQEAKASGKSHRNVFEGSGQMGNIPTTYWTSLGVESPFAILYVGFLSYTRQRIGKYLDLPSDCYHSRSS
jgi:hypothetical protein